MIVPTMEVRVRTATPADHDAIFKVAKTSKYTKDFSNRVMFSSDAAYEKGWIAVAETDEGEIIGFTCVRHKSREPKTMLYFITVRPDWGGHGIGRDLLDAVMAHSPHRVMELNVMKDNEALNFYLRLGFRIVGDAMGGQAHRLEKEWP